MEVQTRTAEGELFYFDTLAEAYSYAEKDPSVWKISFALPTGERVRLVRRELWDNLRLWVWEDMMREVEKELQKP